MMIPNNMLGDIIKAFEILLRAIKDAKSPAARRPEIGRKLKEVLLDLDSLIDAGSALLSMQSRRVTAKVLLKALHSKQTAIERTLRHLKEKDLFGLISIFLPEFTALNALLHAKHAGVGFMLGQLISITPRVDTLLLDLSRDDKKRPLYKGGYSLEAFSYYRPMSLEALGGELHDYGDRVSTVFATDDEVAQFREIIEKLKQLRDDLQKFLSTEFKIEELTE